MLFTQLDFVKPLPDGTPYRNVVMQRMVMRWGRVTEILTLEDTQTAYTERTRQSSSGSGTATRSTPSTTTV